MDVQDIQDSSRDRWGQSKITTGSAVANVIGDFTLTPAFQVSVYFYSAPRYHNTTTRL